MALAEDLNSFLYFGGAEPNLADGVEEVPMPEGYYACMDCGKVTNYWKPGMVCGLCEMKGEQQMEDDRGN